MGLIKCTECGKVFSDKAEKCPNCGCPIEKMENPEKIADTERSEEKTAMQDDEVPGNEDRKSRAENTPDEKNETEAENGQSNPPGYAGQEDIPDAASLTEETDTSAEKEKKGKAAAKKKTIILCIAAAAAAAVVVWLATANLRGYHTAEKTFASGDYSAAMEQFSALGDYKDAATQVMECQYQIGLQELGDQKYKEALASFNALKDYRDSETQADECEYQIATQELSNKKYEEALASFRALKEYKYSETQANECTYQLAAIDYTGEKYQDALDKYNSISDYKDAPDKIAECEYQLSADGSFIRELSKGLEERWAQSDKDDAGARPTMNEGAKCADYCDIELKHIESFENETFNDTALGEEAVKYINIIRQAKEETNYFTADYTRFITNWNDIYNERAILIDKFVENNGLTVTEQYQDYLNELTTAAKGANAENETEESIQKMADAFTITSSSDEYGYYTYKISMSNTTDITFESFYVEVTLQDANGTVVGTGSSDSLSNWAPGQTAEVNVYFTDDQTDLSAYTIRYVPHYSAGTMFN